MQRMIKAANGDPKKLEAMKQRMQQEMKKRGGAKAGAPRRAAAAAAGGAPKLPKPVLDRIRKESGGDPKKAKAMASKAAQEMQKRSGGGARKGAAAGSEFVSAAVGWVSTRGNTPPVASHVSP